MVKYIDDVIFVSEKKNPKKAWNITLEYFIQKW